jgi:threonyl-tRNA synthetase
MNAKIRDAQNQKVPYMLVIGDKEQENNQVALRLRNGDNPGAMDISTFVALVNDEVQKKI